MNAAGDPESAGSTDPDTAVLLARIRDLEQRQARADEQGRVLAQALDAIEAAGAAVDIDPPPDSDDEAEEEDSGAGTPPPPVDMDRLYDWVHDHVGEWAQRKTSKSGSGTAGIQWCSEWFEHPEAVSRFEALRVAWTGFVRSTKTDAMVVYFRDFYDRTMDAVTAATGPFYACTPHKHTCGEFIPIAPAPWRTESEASAAEAVQLGTHLAEPVRLGTDSQRV